MQRLLCLLACLILASGTGVVNAVAQQTGSLDDVKATAARFVQEFDKITAAEENALAPAKAALIKDLERLRDTAKAKGDFAAVLDAEAAIEAAHRKEPAPPAKVLGTNLARARGVYERAKAQVLWQFSAQRLRLEGDYNRAMGELEQRFTKADNLSAAKEVRDARLAAPLGVGVDMLPMMSGERQMKDGTVVVESEKKLTTDVTFRPPVEISYTFKVDNQVRLGFGCDAMIFNWEVNGSELRLDGGPANQQHRAGAGKIPKNQFIVIRQVVLPTQMVVFVDDRERARWKADFSGVNDAVSIWPAGKSTLAIKQIVVRKLREGQ